MHATSDGAFLERRRSPRRLAAADAVLEPRRRSTSTSPTSPSRTATRRSTCPTAKGRFEPSRCASARALRAAGDRDLGVARRAVESGDPRGARRRRRRGPRAAPRKAGLVLSARGRAGVRTSRSSGSSSNTLSRLPGRARAPSRGALPLHRPGPPPGPRRAPSPQRSCSSCPRARRSAGLEREPLCLVDLAEVGERPQRAPPASPGASRGRHGRP